MPSQTFSASRRALLSTAVAAASAGLSLSMTGCATPASKPSKPSGAERAGIGSGFRHLDADARALWRALLPAIGRGQPELARQETAFLQGIDSALHAFSPHNQSQLNDLFGLLALAPSRLLLTGHWKSWPEFSPDETHAVLERWRTSSLGLLNQAYAGLTRLGAATLYSLPDVKQSTGYPGPPRRALEALPQFRTEAAA